MQTLLKMLTTYTNFIISYFKLIFFFNKKAFLNPGSRKTDKYMTEKVQHSHAAHEMQFIKELPYLLKPWMESK